MKPKNFPERKRQRQLGALQRLESGKAPNAYASKRTKSEITKLKERTKHNLRERRTKKRRA